MKKIHTIDDLCSGCRLCQLVCSFINTNEFNPKKAKIRIAHVDEQGIYMPIVDCDGSECPYSSDNKMPKCVEVCATGALIYATLDESAEMKKDLVRKRAVQPIFKVIAPWKWPFPWKEWPFEEAEKNE